VDVAQQISVTAALEAAQGRLQRGLAVEIEDAVEVRPRSITPAALPAEKAA